MKIGILSMQKILNYGSFLQAFSLKKQLEERGHDVYFIDIKTGRFLHERKPRKINILSKLDKYFFKRVANFLLMKKMTRIHINDYVVFLNTDKKLEDGESFDLVVIGSDEVFNATSNTSWGFSDQLFGNIENTKNVVTYAASCGSTTFESAETFGIVDEIRQAMSHIKKISVRDENTVDFVRAVTGITPELNVDPVFLANYDEYIPQIKIKKPYMVVYAYENRINDKDEISAIQAYAKKNKLEILCIGVQQRWCSNCIAATAFELLAYIKNAECVVTDTFHGTVYSIKYNKRFVTFIRDSNRNKLGGLLKQFGLLERSVEDVSKFESVLDSSVNFEAINSVIASEQKKSKKYLDDVCGVC